MRPISYNLDFKLHTQKTTHHAFIDLLLRTNTTSVLLLVFPTWPKFDGDPTVN